MKGPHYNLLPPSNLVPNDEPLPMIVPPLRDLAAPTGRWVSEQDLQIIEIPDQPLGPDVQSIARDIALNIALADKRVSQLLENKRYIAIGLSVIEQKGVDKGAVQAPQVLFVFYNYSDNKTIEVTLDMTGQRVTNLQESTHQPAPIEQEVREIVELARADRRLSSHLSDELEARIIPISSANPDDSNYSHRLFEVDFVRPDERMPRHKALVDLSTRVVFHVDLDLQ